MLLILAMTATGACLGTLLASATVPRVKMLPLLSTLALTLIAAGTLLALDPGNIVAALLFVAAVGLASALCGGGLWRRALPELPHGLGWFCWTSFAHPGYLRSLQQQRETERVPAEYAQR